MENIFQLTPDGKYAASLAFFVEYSHSALRDQPSSFTLGPIVQKELNDVFGVDTLHTLNLFLTRDVGHNRTSDTGFTYAAQSKLLLHPLLNPGIELYGDLTSLTHVGPTNQQPHSAGPVITGAYLLASYAELKYEIGYQFGLTSQTPQGGVRWKFEYEISF